MLDTMFTSASQVASEEIREQVAHLVAVGDYTDRAIAEMLSITVAEIVLMRSLKNFKQRVADIREDINYTLIKQGIANKQNRVNQVNERWMKCQQIIEDRAKDPMFKDVPGGSTGLMTVTYKSMGRVGIQEEYQVDTALMAEMRAMELAVAKELGQIIDKSSVDVSTRSMILNVTGEIDKYEKSFLQALQVQGLSPELPEPAATPPVPELEGKGGG